MGRKLRACQAGNRVHTMNNIETMKRRPLLHRLCVGAPSRWLPHRAWSQVRLLDSPFALGVASGSPGSDSDVLWTRLHSHSVLSARAPTLRWELAHDEHFKRPVQSGQKLADSQLAHAVHVAVNGLDSDRWYFYRFMVGDAVSPVGRTRTFPKPDSVVDRLRLAYAWCQKWEDGYFTVWRHMRDEKLDAVMFLGDYIYEYLVAGSRLRTPGGGWAVSLDDYRRRYALYRGDTDLQATHAACPWLLTWDDHEAQNDYGAPSTLRSRPILRPVALRPTRRGTSICRSVRRS